MSRGQWIDYNNFNLVNLIDELKTRFDNEMAVDSTLHGIIVGRDYYGICKEIKDFLERDDNKWRTENKNKVDKLLQKINYIEVESINNSYLKLGKKYTIVGHDGCSRRVGDYLVINDNYKVEWIRQDFFKEEYGCTKDLLLFEERYFDIDKYLEKNKL